MRTRQEVRDELEKLALVGLAAAARRDRAASLKLIPKAQALMRELNEIEGGRNWTGLIDSGNDLITQFRGH